MFYFRIKFNFVVCRAFNNLELLLVREAFPSGDHCHRELFRTIPTSLATHLIYFNCHFISSEKNDKLISRKTLLYLGYVEDFAYLLAKRFF